jgi:hypothetical protein
MFSVASGSSRARQQAAIQVSLIGRGRPRSLAWVWTPDGRCVESARQDDDAGEEGSHARAAAGSPAVEVRPSGQLADRDEGGGELLAGELVSEAVGQLSLEDR